MIRSGGSRIWRGDSSGGLGTASSRGRAPGGGIGSKAPENGGMGQSPQKLSSFANFSSQF